MAKDPFPKTTIERLLELENSATRLARIIEENDPARFAKRIIDDDFARIAGTAEGSKLTVLARQASQVQEALKQFAATPQYEQFIRGTSAFLEILREPATVAAIRDANERVARLVLNVQPVIAPAALSMGRLMEELARSIKPYEGALKTWQASLAERMAVLDRPWAFEAEVRISASGFARLARLSDALHAPTPFADNVSDLLREELGEIPPELEVDTPIARDAAALEAGMHAELIAFPSGEYPRITVAAGFSFRIPLGQVPHAIESGELGAVYDPMHNAVVTHLEQALRQRVQGELFRIAGDSWVKQRVPYEIRERWEQRQERDRNSSRQVFAAIEYADFMDISAIVCKRDNWRDAFGAIFIDRDEFQVSMRRLHPVRRALGHSRPLGKSDVLTLLAESTRLFRSLGIDVLS